MNWIRPAKRLAIYLRDGLACAWCGASVEDGARLTLDHVRPHSLGGDNHPTNLVTACLRCNSSRGARGVAAFARAVASYLELGSSATVVAHVRQTAKRAVPLAEAKAMIARRGGLAAVLGTKGA